MSKAKELFMQIRERESNKALSLESDIPKHLHPIKNHESKKSINQGLQSLKEH